MISRYRNHTLQTNPLNREEVPQNTDCHKKSGRQWSNLLSLLHQDDCKTRRNKVLNNKSNLTVSPPSKRRLVCCCFYVFVGGSRKFHQVGSSTVGCTNLYREAIEPVPNWLLRGVRTSISKATYSHLWFSSRVWYPALIPLDPPMDCVCVYLSR